MADHTSPKNMSAYDLVEWIVQCQSLEDIHSVATDWLRSNPPRKDMAHILAKVDDMLAGLYAREYDPRVVSPAVDELIEIAEHLLPPDGEITARTWVDDFIHAPHEALDHDCPVRLLSTPEGRNTVKRLLINQFSGPGD